MTKTLKTILACAFAALLGTAGPALYAQGTRTVGGTVLDERGEPLYGAFVIQQGTSNGVSTGLDGKYSSGCLPAKSSSSSSSSGMRPRR